MERISINHIIIRVVLIIAGYYWLFPTESVLIVEGCSSSQCRWEDVGKSAFKGDEKLWEQCQQSGKYAVLNKTGKSLRMKPVSYGSTGYTGGRNKNAFSIPTGLSIVDERPNYLMLVSPDQISTSRHAGKVVRWELWCN